MENLQFRDGALSESITMGSFSSGAYDGDNDALAGLGNFLSRPVRIASITWTEAVFLQQSLKPWDLFFNDTKIINKLQNYSRIRCKLKLKFILNASPFYFGSVRACYAPLQDPRSVYFNIADQVPFSQMPGVYLEPQNMTTAEMELPFLFPRNWIDITKRSEFQNMGTLNLLQYANLRSANGVSGQGITLNVYAWAEDVTLAGPTVDLALQSDEYCESNGVISAPLTTLSNIAGKLTDTPVIGSFASATQIGAKAAAGIAKLFGYSNPPIIDDVQPVMPKTFHAFANVETRVPIDKLSIDPKNEVTISSGVAGVEEDDPLMIQKLVSHESFILGTNWSDANPPDYTLWSGVVNPGYVIISGISTTSPPMAYFGEMFKFWRGSLIYKFRFIKTKYHKGRVLISWDPNGGNIINTDTETTNMTRIVDLEFEDEVEFVVPYKATTPYLGTTFSSAMLSNGPSPSFSYNNTLHNGAITMRVQNILTGPAASQNIDILTYVRAGPDFVFAVPDEINMGLTSRDPAGNVQSEAMVDGSNHTFDEHVASITTGESIASLRPLLHRASLATAQTVGRDPDLTQGFHTVRNNYYRYPKGVGRDTIGYNRASIGGLGVGYNFVPNHPIDWVSNAFVGMRGSTNMHFNVQGMGESIKQLTHFAAERIFSDVVITAVAGNRNGGNTVTNTTQDADLSAAGLVGISSNPVGQRGMSLTNPVNQGALSINVPQYSNVRFTQAFHSVRERNYAASSFTSDNVSVTMHFFSNAVGTPYTWPVLMSYVSAGVDFQPIFFLCTPRLFVNTFPSGFVI